MPNDIPPPLWRPLKPPAATRSLHCSSSASSGQFVIPMTTLRPIARSAKSRGCTLTTLSGSPTSRSFRSWSRTTCVTITRLGCSLCHASRWLGYMPRAAPPASRSLSAIPGATSTTGPTWWHARFAPQAAGPAIWCMWPTATACSPVVSVPTMEPSGWAAPSYRCRADRPKSR